jgi:hypothetical protein
MSERNFLQYRLAVADLMPDSPYKTALVAAIESRLATLTQYEPAPAERVIENLKLAA